MLTTADKEIIEKLVASLKHKEANNILPYEQEPLLVLAIINLILFDKINECIDKINCIEDLLNAKRKETFNSQRN